MNAIFKKLTIFTMLFSMIFSLSGCALFDSKAKVYSKYVTSLLDINYKNISEDYSTLTGVSSKDAEAVYIANMDYQAHNLMKYYGVKEVDDGTVLSEFYYLAQSIFADAKYEVTDVIHDKENNTYTLELTIHPLATLEQTHDQVVQYITEFNASVDDGNYDNTTEIDYETEFAEGIIDILKNTTEKPSYMDPIVLEIPIQPSEDNYFIKDEDFLKIDEHILYVRDRENSLKEDTETKDEKEDTETKDEKEETKAE